MIERIDPWAHLADAFSASARRRRAIRNRLGMRFREAQQEAYASWAEWDEAMGAEDFELAMAEEDTGTVINDLNDIWRHRAQEEEIETQQEDTPFDFALAASGHHDISSNKDSVPEEDLIEIDMLDINGTEYMALSNKEGDVFLHPCPDTTFISLRLGEDLYALKHVDLNGEKYCFVVDLDQGELDHFLGRQRRDGSHSHMTFEK